MFVYGIPASWPHVRELLVDAGFVHEGRVEILSVVDVDDLPRPGRPPLDGLTVRRSVGDCGTRFSAVRGDEVVGLVEVETDYTAGGTRSRYAGWSDIGNLCVREPERRKGVATWLLGHAGDWLRLGRVDRLVAYAWPEQTDQLGFYSAVGFRELVRTERGWRRQRPA